MEYLSSYTIYNEVIDGMKAMGISRDELAANLQMTLKHHQNPENVKIWFKIGRIMWKSPLKIARIMWKAPIKLWEFEICKSRIEQIIKQIYLSYLIDISNNMI